MAVAFFGLVSSVSAQIEPDEICPAEWVAQSGLEGSSGTGCGDFTIVAFVAVLKNGECEGVGPCHIIEPAYVDIKYVGGGDPNKWELFSPGSVYPPPPPNQNNIFHVRFHGDSPCDDYGSQLVVEVEIYHLTTGGPFLVCTGWNTLVCNQCQLEGE
jgi:hypothetical protein